MWCVSCCEGGGGSAAPGDWRLGAGEWFAQCRQGGRKSCCCSDEPYPLSQHCNVMRTQFSPLKHTYLPTYKAHAVVKVPPMHPQGTLFKYPEWQEKWGCVTLSPTVKKAFAFAALVTNNLTLKSVEHFEQHSVMLWDLNPTVKHGNSFCWVYFRRTSLIWKLLLWLETRQKSLCLQSLVRDRSADPGHTLYSFFSFIWLEM